MSMDAKTYDWEPEPKVKLALLEFQTSAQTKFKSVLGDEPPFYLTGKAHLPRQRRKV